MLTAQKEIETEIIAELAQKGKYQLSEICFENESEKCSCLSEAQYNHYSIANLLFVACMLSSAEILTKPVRF